MLNEPTIEKLRGLRLGAMADAWATALSVLGPIEGRAVAEREGISALFILRTKGGYDAVATSLFEARHGVLASSP